MNGELQEMLKTLPEKPGVYLMHDRSDTVIYVGKAKILKNRVRQYFQSSKNHSPKVLAMVAHIHHFEYIVTDNETEALMLECNLIKKYKPKYNILLKDDKHYPFIKIETGKDYPGILITRKRERDSAKYYGPYLNASVARETLELLRKTFGLYSCHHSFPRDCGKIRPCLYYHIHQCCGVCTGKITPEEYKENIFRAERFLEGKTEGLKEEFAAEMKKASHKMEYEKAAYYRDQLKNIETVSEKQKMLINVTKEQDYIGFAQDGDDACVQVFFVRDGKVLGREHFPINRAGNEKGAELLGSFMKQFYHARERIPKEIRIQEEPEDKDEIAVWLSALKGSKVSLSVPKRGDGKAMMEMVRNNALQSLENIRKADNKTKALLLELKEEFQLPVLPRRIESYDISNTAGADSVGGMVVFFDGIPFKRAYRKFKIQSVTGADDYASMCEVLFRRMNQGEEERNLTECGELSLEQAKFYPFPDLILLDGGKGHVRTVNRMMNERGWKIPVLGMVKDDRHKTRAVTDGEREFSFGVSSPIFRFFTKIQDEVHRYAISYHKKLHKKNQMTSSLEAISGIGPAKRNALLRHFGSITAIKQAEQEELLCVPGITKPLAQRIYETFHGSNTVSKQQNPPVK